LRCNSLACRVAILEQPQRDSERIVDGPLRRTQFAARTARPAPLAIEAVFPEVKCAVISNPAHTKDRS
jgi:hypothetical protein